MNALITGASGFIGSHLAAALTAAGHRVRCLVRATSRTDRLPADNIELVYGDVTDLPSVRQATKDTNVVFHLAGLVKALNLQGLLRVNEQGTQHVAQACAEQPVPPVLVLVSSLAAAGPSPDGRSRIESDPAQPVSNYGRSKRAGELAALRFADRVPLTIVRPPVVFGEGDPALVSAFLPIKWLRMHFVPGFSQRRASLVHAADLVAGLLAAAERGERAYTSELEDPARGIYYFASERDPTLGEFGELLARSMGRRGVRVVYAPAFLGWGAAGGNELLARIRRQANIFSFDKMRELTAGSWVCGADRAREQLGFSVAADLETRMAQTAAWYQQEGWI